MRHWLLATESLQGTYRVLERESDFTLYCPNDTYLLNFDKPEANMASIIAYLWQWEDSTVTEILEII